MWILRWKTTTLDGDMASATGATRFRGPVLGRAAWMAIALAGALLVVGTARATAQGGIAGGATVGIEYANLSGAKADLEVGGRGGVDWSMANVAACRSGAQFLPSQPEIVPENQSWLRSVQGSPVGAVLRWDWHTTGAAAHANAAAPSTRISLPLALIDYVTQSSIFIVRNPNDEMVSVTAELFAQGESAALRVVNLDIEAGGVLSLDLNKQPGFLGVAPNTAYGFLGSMTLSADRPVAAWTLVDIASSDKAVYAFAGAPPESAGETLFAPLVRKRFFGYDTGIAVVNPNDRPVEVSVDYVGGAAGGASSCAGQRVTHGPITVPASGGHVFYQGPGGGSGLPDGCVGSAVIRSEGGPVQAIVNDSFAFTQTAAAYPAVALEDASTMLALPLVRREHMAAMRMTTGIQVMNPTAATATVNIELFGDGSLPACGPGCRAEIPPLGTHTFYPGVGGFDGLPPDSFAAGRIVSDVPVLAIVNDVSETGQIDMSTYTALPCGGSGPQLVALP